MSPRKSVHSNSFEYNVLVFMWPHLAHPWTSGWESAFTVCCIPCLDFCIAALGMSCRDYIFTLQITQVFRWIITKTFSSLICKKKEGENFLKTSVLTENLIAMYNILHLWVAAWCSEKTMDLGDRQTGDDSTASPWLCELAHLRPGCFSCKMLITYLPSELLCMLNKSFKE